MKQHIFYFIIIITLFLCLFNLIVCLFLYISVNMFMLNSMYLCYIFVTMLLSLIAHTYLLTIYLLSSCFIIIIYVFYYNFFFLAGAKHKLCSVIFGAL